MLNSEEATSDANERRTAARIERTYYSVFCLTYIIPAARGASAPCLGGRVGIFARTGLSAALQRCP
jgi:hypothetical protein